MGDDGMRPEQLADQVAGLAEAALATVERRR